MNDNSVPKTEASHYESTLYVKAVYKNDKGEFYEVNTRTKIPDEWNQQEESVKFLTDIKINIWKKYNPGLYSIDYRFVDFQVYRDRVLVKNK